MEKFFTFIAVTCFERIGKGYLLASEQKETAKYATKRIVQIAIRYRGYLEPI